MNACRSRPDFDVEILARFVEGAVRFSGMAQQEQRPGPVGEKVTEDVEIHAVLQIGGSLGFDAAIQKFERLLRLDALPPGRLLPECCGPPPLLAGF